MRRDAILLSRNGVSAATALANAEAAIVAGDPQIDAHITALAQAAVSDAFPSGTNRYYENETLVPMSSGATSGFVMVANRLQAIPVLLPAGTYTKIGCSVGTFAASSAVHFSIFDFGDDGYPGLPHLEAVGNVASDANGEKESTIALVLDTLTPLWLAVESNGTPSIFGYTAATQSTIGYTAGNSTNRVGSVYVAHTFGDPIPSPFGTPTVSVTAPRIWVRH